MRFGMVASDARRSLDYDDVVMNVKRYSVSLVCVLVYALSSLGCQRFTRRSSRM
jgi:hypothetical protein